MSTLDQSLRLLTSYFFDSTCHDILFKNFELGTFITGGCFKIAFSKLLSYLIVAGSILVKVPQIITMVKNSSSKGISSSAVLIDTVMVASTMAYGYCNNYTFATYGDSFFVFIQTAVILILIPYYSKSYFYTFIFTIFSFVTSYSIYTNLIPLEYVLIAQQMTIPAVVTSRGIQILTNWSNSSTGQLSTISYFMSFVGCASRVFTSLVDAEDKLMALSFGVACFLNGLVLFQIIYYGMREKKNEKQERKTK